MYLGVDIGGTNIKTGVLDENALLIEKNSAPTNSNREFEDSLKNILEIIEDVLSKRLIKSIGIGLPGTIDESGKIKLTPNLPDWNDKPFQRLLAEKLDADLPIAIDNDANVAALAELKLGAGKNLDDFIYITLGTGVGGAIISQGEILRGSNGAAGEIGHIIIDKNAEKQNTPAYRQGTLEELIGRNQIIETAKSLIKKYPRSRLRKLDNFDVEDIAETATIGDRAALECFQIVGKDLGVALASTANLLDVPVFIIGGGISQSPQTLFDSALKTAKERSLPFISKSIQIVKSKFQADAGIIGAALLGKSELENKE